MPVSQKPRGTYDEQGRLAARRRFWDGVNDVASSKLSPEEAAQSGRNLAGAKRQMEVAVRPAYMRRLRRVGYGLAAADAVALGHAGYKAHQRKKKREAKGMGVRKSTLPFSPGSGSKVRSVSPVYQPAHGTISHENDLFHTHTQRKDPIGAQLRMYRSGSKARQGNGLRRVGKAVGPMQAGTGGALAGTAFMAGAGRSQRKKGYGQGYQAAEQGQPSKYAKRLSTQQGAAVFAKRGTPMSDLHRQSRIGRRLTMI